MSASAPVAEIASQALTGDNLALTQTRVAESNVLREQLSTWLAAQPWCEQVFASEFYITKFNFI